MHRLVEQNGKTNQFKSYAIVAFILTAAIGCTKKLPEGQWYLIEKNPPKCSRMKDDDIALFNRGLTWKISKVSKDKGVTSAIVICNKNGTDWIANLVTSERICNELAGISVDVATGKEIKKVKKRIPSITKFCRFFAV